MAILDRVPNLNFTNSKMLDLSPLRAANIGLTNMFVGGPKNRDANLSPKHISLRPNLIP